LVGIGIVGVIRPVVVFTTAAVALETTIAYADRSALTRRGATMARMIAEPYDALRSAGADEDKAWAAATAIAGQWEIGPRIDQMDRRFDQIDMRIDTIEERLDRLEDRFDRMEDRFGRLEQRVSRLETEVGIIKWMLGFTLAFQVATLFFIWQLMLPLPA
jgi:predicted nuclease with TOPRIM domain